MKKLLISVLVFLLIASTNAHAVQQSTVNPLIPVQNAPLQSAPIRNNFLATYNDINNIYGLISANGSTSVYLGSPFSANPSIQNDPASGFFTAGTQRVDVNIAGTQIFEWNSSGATLNSGLLTLVNPLSGASGGTGVNNTGKTITLGGNLATSGAFNSTFTMTGATNVTFPTSGTLLTSGATTGIYLGTSVTATNPQISTDATTGLYTAGAAEVDVSISGTKRLSVTSTITTTFGSLSVNGNFGVGAGSVMTVNGTTGNTGVSGTLQVTGHVTFEGVTSTGAIGTGNLVFSISPTFTGTTTAAALNLSGAEAITSTSANALSVGANGTTNPALNVDNSTASSATGVSIKSAAAAAGASILVTSSGTNEFLNLTAKGNSFIRPRNSSGSTTGPSTTPVIIVQNTDATVNNLVPIAFRNSNGNTLSQIESVASSQSAGTGVLNIYGFGAGTGTLGLSVGSTGAVEAPVTLAVGTSSIAGTGTVLDLGNAANASLALGLPVGTTGQRPAGANGMLRYNSTGSGAVESYINGAWTALSTGNQTITLSGDVTGSGTTAITTTVAKITGTVVSGTTGSTNVVFSTSPTLTGSPLAPTQTAGDNSTKIATTAYVDSAVVASNPAVAVKVATTSSSNTSGLTYNNGASGIGATFTGSVNTALTIDGVTLTTLAQRVLVKNDTQSPSGAFNGVYSLTQLQSAILPPILTRALDYDQPSDINNTGSIPVVSGTVNAGTSWLITSAVATVGTDPLTYTQFSYALSNIAVLNTAQTFTASQSVTPTSLTISTATFTPTFATSNTFKLTLTSACPCTLANPSGTIVPGTDIVIEVKQDGTGSRTIGTYGSMYKFSGATAPTLSTAANITDMEVCHVSDATHLFCGFSSNFAQ